MGKGLILFVLMIQKGRIFGLSRNKDFTPSRIFWLFDCLSNIWDSFSFQERPPRDLNVSPIISKILNWFWASHCVLIQWHTYSCWYRMRWPPPPCVEDTIYLWMMMTCKRKSLQRRILILSSTARGYNVSLSLVFLYPHLPLVLFCTIAIGYAKSRVWCLLVREWVTRWI